MKRVKISFATLRDGQPFVVSRGRLIADDHPLVRQFPDNFEDLTEDIRNDAETYGRAVERATANPGELRSVAPAPEPVKEEQSTEDDDLPKEPISESDYSYAELKALAARAKIDTTGTKGQLVERFNQRFEE